MFAAAAKALSQMVSPPFRAILLKSIGLAVIVLIVLVIALHRVFAWLASGGASWLEPMLGPGAHDPLMALLWLLSVAAGFGLVFGAVFLMPTVTALIASLFGDAIAGEVERTYYPADVPGVDVPIPRAAWEGITFALLTIVVYVCALPFLFVAGLGVVIFFIANAYLLGRQYFELAAMRFHSAAEAKALRKIHEAAFFRAGMLISAFVSIPIVNLATPLFATALMVHLHKQIAGERRELIAPQR
jgi:CysZ protein